MLTRRSRDFALRIQAASEVSDYRHSHYVLFILKASIFADAAIKQQLSSVRFVKSVCDTSIDRLNKGPDVTDSIVCCYIFLIMYMYMYMYMIMSVVTSHVSGS